MKVQITSEVKVLSVAELRAALRAHPNDAMVVVREGHGFQPVMETERLVVETTVPSCRTPFVEAAGTEEPDGKNLIHAVRLG